MKSKTSFINTGMLHNDWKRFAWIGAGYLLALLFAVPLQILMLYSRGEEAGINNVSMFLRVFQFDTLQAMLVIAAPILTGLLLFRYLQDRRAADTAHTLPVRRETCYHTHMAAGLIFLFVPPVLTALVSWALVAGLGIEQIEGTHILTWLSASLLFSLLFFTCSAAVGMITGMTTLQGVLSIILLFLPSGLCVLLLYNLNQYIYGFPYDLYLSQINDLSPLIRLTEISRNPLQPGEIFIYLGVSVVLYIVGKNLYLQRHTEMAGNAITFAALRPLFKYSVTFCSMLLAGSYFNAVQDSMAWTYFGYLLGSLLAYILIEILLHKSLYIFHRRHLKGYGIYALVMVVLVGLFHFDWTGYEKRLPALDTVKSIYMDYSFYPLTYRPAAVPPDAQADDYIYTPVKAIFTGQENIARIHALHRQIIANRSDREASAPSLSTRYTRNICLAYELNGGKWVYRQYNIAEPDYADSLQPIYESGEYKELHNRTLGINPAEVDFIDIEGYGANKRLRLVDPELMAQALAALKKDIYAESYTEMVNLSGKTPWAHVHIHMDHRSFIQDWKKSYVYFEQWLKDSGNHDRVRLLPGVDINYALLDRPPDRNGADRQQKPGAGQLDIQALENKPGVLKITDPAKMEWCLRHYQGNREGAAYQVFFALNGGDVLSGFLDAAGAAPFIQEHDPPAAETLAPRPE